MKTTIAVTTNKKGDKLVEHAGHARFFKFYEIDEKEGILSSEVVKVDKEHTLHNLIHGTGINPAEHRVLNSQMLLTGGIGQGAIHKLSHYGVRAYIILENNPDTAVQQLIEGKLQAVDPASHQHTHHDHNHDHGHDHNHEHGQGCNHC